MSESNNPKHNIHRRDILKGATVASLALATGAIGVPKTFGQASARSTSSGQVG